MKAITRVAITTTAVLLVGAGALALRTLIKGGVFTEVTPQFEGACRAIPAPAGAEDIAIDRKDGLLFASVTDWRRIAGDPNPADGLYVLRLDGAGGLARLKGAPSNFHPHGISLFRATDGSLTLMAVNHLSQQRSAIDIFEVSLGEGGPALNEIGDIESDKLVSANDVAAVGREQFYVTNDHGSLTGIGKTLETYLLLPRANVLYFDGSVFKEAAAGLTFANGVALSQDGRELYVAESTARRIRAFSRDPFSGRLTALGAQELPAGPDNIDVDETGHLWVGAHPKMFALLDYAKDPSKPSPSEIFEFATANGAPGPAKLVYADLGTGIGAASVGAVAKGHLYIGSIFAPKILDCRLP
ncbi:MAG TPA: SMP-30/gluconolactonase/LRE family protein [Rhizomicrobium sp.]|jgi:arylesterase/paraoxonase|nr:SMP-30/gluconolactonase/LRE family protein [Rhizomicrobium sp.]